MLSIRTANTKDIELIIELAFAIWPNAYGTIISQQQIDYMLDMMYSPTSLQKQMVEDGCNFIIVNDAETPVGFASYNKIEATVWKLNKLYILPTQQGKGTGKFVIDYIVAEIKKQNAAILQLQVNKQNKAKWFYEKLGFTVANEFVFEIGNGFVMDDYVMVLVVI
jgi:diamine N-acetyltransferase